MSQEVREPSAKYLAKLGYKQTEVGLIPEDWDVTPFGRLFAWPKPRGDARTV